MLQRHHMRPLIIAILSLLLANSTALAQPDNPDHEPKCEEVSFAEACWIAATDKPDCRVWHQGWMLYKTWSWLGSCEQGVPHGKGMEQLDVPMRSYRTIKGKGVYVHGLKEGHWFLSRSAWNRNSSSSGSYVNGKRSGIWWIVYDGHGGFAYGPYVDGKRHGKWMLVNGDGNSGDTEKGSYVNGVRQGRWVMLANSGDIHEGPMVDDKRHGDWEFRYMDGRKVEGSYVNGKSHGIWVTRYQDGRVETVRYVNGRLEEQ